MFRSLSTQWRTGAGGPTGLDYTVLYAKFARLKLPPEEEAEMEYFISQMELSALAEIYAKQ